MLVTRKLCTPTNDNCAYVLIKYVHQLTNRFLTEKTNFLYNFSIPLKGRRKKVPLWTPGQRFIACLNTIYNVAFELLEHSPY